MAIFITNYIAMLPAANLLGFAGQELSRKMPQKAFAVLLETTFGSLVELILFMVLLKKGAQNIPVIQAAILGSILANVLLCLGFCFIAGKDNPWTGCQISNTDCDRWYQAHEPALSRGCLRIWQRSAACCIKYVP